MSMKSLMKYIAPVTLAVAATTAMAGSGGSEFDDVSTLLTDWAEGTVGRILAIGALIVGIAFGLVRQSVIAAVVGLSMAVVLAYGPTVINNIFTFAADGSVASQVALLANGLF